jgi:hypothetical protein
MTGLLKKAGLGIALAATAIATTAAPADAQRYGGYGRGYHGYGRGGGDVAAGALLGGIVGLGVGAAIANSGRDRYYDRGYYNDGYYYNRPRVVYRERYYAPPPRVIYRERYYAPRYGYGYYGY